MRVGSIICLAVFILGALASLVQLWFTPMSAEFYSKTMVTLGVVFVVVLGTTLVMREFFESQELKDSGHIG